MTLRNVYLACVFCCFAVVVVVCLSVCLSLSIELMLYPASIKLQYGIFLSVCLPNKNYLFLQSHANPQTSSSPYYLPLQKTIIRCGMLWLICECCDVLPCPALPCPALPLPCPCRCAVVLMLCTQFCRIVNEINRGREWKYLLKRLQWTCWPC